MQRKPLYLLAALTCLAFAVQLLQSAPADAADAKKPIEFMPAPAPAVLSAPAHDKRRPGRAELAADALPLSELARKDPMVLARMGRERYGREVRDYICTFEKQERLDSGLTAVQKIKVLYREKPHSVYMTWLENPDQCRRALYVAGRDTSKKGEALAQVEPAGAVARFFVSDTLVPIHGSRSRKASRRSIDEFGFKSTLDLLVRYNTVAAEKGQLELFYAGEGAVDGRPTYVIVRHLPYDGPKGVYPDARMVIHFDQEWLLPVAVYSWADREEKHLLGSYVMKDVQLNAGLTDDAFRF